MLFLANFEYTAAFLQDVCNRHQMGICIKDFIGFLPINKQLDAALQPFAAHTNPFCMFIKQDKKLYMRCLASMRPMYNRCLQERECFSGMCYAGMYECVVPIRIGDEVLGSINASYCSGDREVSHRLIRRLFCQEPEKAEHAVSLFERYVPTPTVQPVEVLPMLHMLSEYLAMTYAGFKFSHAVAGSPRHPRDQQENLLITQAREYIGKNYVSALQVGEIARHCHCSESYISHMFTKHTGININTYINKIRIDHAKYYLLTTSDSISTIALNVGFSDPNYFSRVFASLVAIPATEFRRRYTT